MTLEEAKIEAERIRAASYDQVEKIIAWIKLQSKCPHEIQVANLGNRCCTVCGWLDLPDY